MAYRGRALYHLYCFPLHDEVLALRLGLLLLLFADQPWPVCLPGYLRVLRLAALDLFGVIPSKVIKYFTITCDQTFEYFKGKVIFIP